MQSTIDRRTLIAGAAAATGAMLASGAVIGLAEEAAEWNYEADVVVLGAGGAGLRAAYAAREAGASVLVLEKADTFGGSSIRSEGMIQAAGTPTQEEVAGITTDTPEAHKAFYMLYGEGQIEEDLVTDMCEHAPEHIAFLESLGMKFVHLSTTEHTPYSDAAGMEIPPRIHQTEGGATEVFTVLHDAGVELGVEYLYNTAATALVQDADGAVIGVEAIAEDGSPIRVQAHKGVVVATASIDNNVELAKRLNPQQYRTLTDGTSFVATAPTNTGDGLIMGLRIGAQIRNVCGTIDMTLRTWLGINVETTNVPSILVGANGRRFVCEDDTYAFVARAIYNEETSTGHKVWEIIGANGLPVMTPMGEMTAEGLDAEVEAGVAFKADTLEELAAAIDVNPEIFAAEVAAWNASVEAGADELFGRRSALVAIEPPYYAISENGVCNMGSIGGLAINTDAQVLDNDNNPIPHLFAAGAASAGWMGPYYPGSGTALLGTQHWGWRAGTNAAAQEAIA